MSVFKRGKVWWYEFQFRGNRIRESTHSPAKDVAIRAERERRRKLELGANHLEAVRRVPQISVAMAAYLEANVHWSTTLVGSTARTLSTFCRFSAVFP